MSVSEIVTKIFIVGLSVLTGNIFIIFGNSSCFAANAYLVKDINTTYVYNSYPQTYGSGPGPFAQLGAQLIFVASDDTHGYELWKSDGSSQGTVMLKDINPGTSSSHIYSIVTLDNNAYFAADDGIDYGHDLWKTNGTSTELVKTLRDAYLFTPVGSNIFFYGDDTGHYKLMKTDGTQTGTGPVTDQDFSNILEMIDINGTLFFTTGADELWKSDGTSSSTVLVKAFVSVGSLSRVGNLLYCVASMDSTYSGYGRELWKSDGTPAGTVMVKDIQPGPDYGFEYSDSNQIVDVNGIAFFAANDGVHGDELWKSDGTPSGTVLVKDIEPGYDTSYISNLRNINGTLFFAADYYRQHLYKSDGTASGTSVVSDTFDCSNPELLTEVDDLVYFASDDFTICRSDGTATGTTVVTSNSPLNSIGWASESLAYVNSRLFFSADDYEHGTELWALDTARNLLALTINGPDSINENASATYTATASWSDGTTSTVSPTWGENSSYATISSSGVLTATAVSGNQTVIVSASYIRNGVTKNNTHTVAIHNFPWPMFLPSIIRGVQ
jgi:ELWxxDGT repeat protein